MDIEKLIGMRVMNTNTHSIGTIEYIRDGIVAIDFYGITTRYSYPSAFAGLLELEDEDLQAEIEGAGVGASFESFKKNFQFAHFFTFSQKQVNLSNLLNYTLLFYIFQVFTNNVPSFLSLCVKIF